MSGPSLELAAIRRIIEDALAARNDVADWIDQFRSPLRLPGQKSSKRHCQLVRDRIARLGPGHGAFISPDLKQFFLTPQAMTEEMSQAGQVRLRKTVPLEPEAPLDEDEDVRTQIRAAMRGHR